MPSRTASFYKLQKAMNVGTTFISEGELFQGGRSFFRASPIIASVGWLIDRCPNIKSMSTLHAVTIFYKMIYPHIHIFQQCTCCFYK